MKWAWPEGPSSPRMLVDTCGRWEAGSVLSVLAAVSGNGRRHRRSGRARSVKMKE